MLSFRFQVLKPLILIAPSTRPQLVLGCPTRPNTSSESNSTCRATQTSSQRRRLVGFTPMSSLFRSSPSCHSSRPALPSPQRREAHTQRHQHAATRHISTSRNCLSSKFFSLSVRENNRKVLNFCSRKPPQHPLIHSRSTSHCSCKVFIHSPVQFPQTSCCSIV